MSICYFFGDLIKPHRAIFIYPLALSLKIHDRKINNWPFYISWEWKWRQEKVEEGKSASLRQFLGLRRDTQISCKSQ